MKVTEKKARVSVMLDSDNVKRFKLLCLERNISFRSWGFIFDEALEAAINKMERVSQSPVPTPRHEPPESRPVHNTANEKSASYREENPFKPDLDGLKKSVNTKFGKGGLMSGDELPTLNVEDL